MGHFELLKILALHRIPVVVIGGHAVTFHGHVRNTEDVDVIWLRSPESEAALLEALQSVNANWLADEIDPSTGLEKLVPVSAAYIASNHLMMLLTDQGWLDVFDYVPGCPDADVNQVFHESIPAGGTRYVSLHWLKRMKAASGRAKDADDLKYLEAE